MAFIARYEGWCPICHKAIVPGEHVTYGADRKVVHAACDEEDE